MCSIDPNSTNVTEKPPKVSIGMPVYNGEPYIREALDSLLAQTFTDFELIISDNASTDNTESICREYAAKDPRIRYIRQAENRGALANFKFVLDQARGEYFMWAAHDDRWGSEFLNITVQILNNDSYCVAAITESINDGDPDKWKGGFYSIEDECPKARVVKFLKKPGANIRFYSLYRSHIIKQINLLKCNCLGGDWYVSIKILTAGKSRLAEGSGVLFFKRGGISSDLISMYDYFRTSRVEYFIPYFQFVKLLIADGYNDIYILYLLIKLNLCFIYGYWRQRFCKFRRKS